MSDDTTATQPGTAADTAPQPGTAATPSTTGETPKTFTQEDINRILAANKREWQKQAQREADEAKAAAEGQFKDLAEQRAQRIAELEQQTTQSAERMAQLEAEMQKQLSARLKALPAEIKAMQPEGDPLVVYAWLDKAEAAASKLTAATTRTPPAGPTGGGGSPFVTGTTDDAIAKKRASGIY